MELSPNESILGLQTFALELLYVFSETQRLANQHSTKLVLHVCTNAERPDHWEYLSNSFISPCISAERPDLCFGETHGLVESILKRPRI